MNIRSQTGFAPVQALLFIVIIGIIGGTGYYVYTANKNTNDALKANNSSTPTFKKSEKKAEKQDQQYIAIKELGIKIPVKSTDTTYDIAVDPNYVGISTKGFQSAVGNCKPENTASSSFPAVIVVTKHTGTFDSNPDKKFDQLGAYDSFGKQFSGFYLSYGTPDGGYCNGAQSTAANTVNQLFNNLKPELESGVKNAQQL